MYVYALVSTCITHYFCCCRSNTCKAKSKKEEKVQKQLRIGIQPLCDPERGAALTVPCDTFMRVRQPPPQTLLLTTPQPHRPSGQPGCSPFVR